jgi:hypothetical protein
MSTATVPWRCTPRAGERSLFDHSVDGGPNRSTLEQLIAGVWEGLAVRGTAACPVCGAAMHARFGAHSRPVDGRCAGCGATLS